MSSPVTDQSEDSLKEKRYREETDFASEKKTKLKSIINTVSSSSTSNHATEQNRGFKQRVPQIDVVEAKKTTHAPETVQRNKRLLGMNTLLRDMRHKIKYTFKRQFDGTFR